MTEKNIVRNGLQLEVRGEVVHVQTGAAPSRGGAGPIALIGWLALIWAVWLVLGFFSRAIALEPMLTGIACTLAVNASALILPMIFLAVIGAVLRVNLLGVVWGVIGAIVRLIGLALSTALSAVLNTVTHGGNHHFVHPAEPRQVQTVVLSDPQTGQMRTLMIVASAHQLLILPGHELRGYGVAWRGLTKMRAVHNLNTDQKWGF